MKKVGSSKSGAKYNQFRWQTFDWNSSTERLRSGLLWIRLPTMQEDQLHYMKNDSTGIIEYENRDCYPHTSMPPRARYYHLVISQYNRHPLKEFLVSSTKTTIHYWNSIISLPWITLISSISFVKGQSKNSIDEIVCSTSEAWDTLSTSLPWIIFNQQSQFLQRPKYE